jgi:hypothetical protein
MNSVSVRTYGQNSDTLAVIRELKKLGIIKSAKRKPKSKAKMMDELKQESDMVGYVKTLEGQSGRGNPNIFSLRQIEPGMSQQQITDIEKRNAAGVATLRAEVQQQRLADIEQQQGQRFSDISKLGGIMNPILERFRGAQDPGAGQRVDPFTQTSTIFLPDIQEETFTETLNEGGPKAQPQVQTELFSEGEELAARLAAVVGAARLGPQERLQIGEGTGMSSAAAQALGMPESFIAKTKKATKPKTKLVYDLQYIADELALGKIPTMRNSYTAIEDYYIALTDLPVGEDRDVSLNSKSDILNEINKILQAQGEI